VSKIGVEARLGEVIALWPEAVGQSIARNAWPSRIGRDGTLHVNTVDSIWAFELAHRGAEIAERLDVAGVRFAPGLLAVTAAEPAVRIAPSPSPEQAQAAAEIASSVSDENLRKSIERAVSLSLAGGGSDRRL